MKFTLIAASALVAIVVTAGLCVPRVQAKKTLAERLGYKPTDKLLIINGDDTGMSHAANVATIDALDHGLMTSATIMVPCPWLNEIVDYAKRTPKADLGIHLTHTSEWKHYRWGPVSVRGKVPTLVDPEGYLWRDVPELYAKATVEEMAMETRAQIDRALKAGIDVTHIDSHMGGIQYRPDFHRAYLEIAREYRLPARMGSPSTYEKAGFPEIRAYADTLGVVYPDRLIHEEEPEPGESRKDFWLRMIRTLTPGVTELYIHASVPTDESKAIHGSWPVRAADYELFTRDPDIRKAIADGGIIRIGYRPLRDLQRQESKR